MKKEDNVCPSCGKYKQEDYEYCYNCSMEDEGKIVCEHCEKNYHSPEYDLCYECTKTDPDHTCSKCGGYKKKEYSTCFPCKNGHRDN